MGCPVVAKWGGFDFDGYPVQPTIPMKGVEPGYVAGSPSGTILPSK